MAEQMEARVKKAIGEALGNGGIDLEIRPWHTLVGIGLDSLRFVKLLVLLEAELAIEFADEELDFAKFETVADLLTCLQDKCKPNGRFQMLNLSPYYNGYAFSSGDDFFMGNFTGMGAAYPVEDLPASDAEVMVNGIPFRFPSKEPGICNNVEMDRQQIWVEQPRRLSKLYVLGASENGSFREKIELQGADDCAQIWLGLTSWTRLEADFGDQEAFRCRALYSQRTGVVPKMKPTIWMQTIDLSQIDFPIESIQLADNPCMHLFAITLLEEEGAETC